MLNDLESRMREKVDVTLSSQHIYIFILVSFRQIPFRHLADRRCVGKFVVPHKLIVISPPFRHFAISPIDVDRAPILTTNCFSTVGAWRTKERSRGAIFLVHFWHTNSVLTRYKRKEKKRIKNTTAIAHTQALCRLLLRRKRKLSHCQKVMSLRNNGRHRHNQWAEKSIQ